MILSFSNTLFRHYGALGNIIIGEDGKHELNNTDSIISLDPSSPSYIGGLAMVLHAGEDDFTVFIYLEIFC